MSISSKTYTNNKKISEIAEVVSGVYLLAAPYGEVYYLQIKDLLSESPEKTASKVTLSAKNEQPTFAKCLTSTFQPSPPPPYI